MRQLTTHAPTMLTPIGPWTRQAGLPKGVLNFVSTSKEDAPARVAQIISHRLVRKVNVKYSHMHRETSQQS